MAVQSMNRDYTVSGLYEYDNKVSSRSGTYSTTGSSPGARSLSPYESSGLVASSFLIMLDLIFDRRRLLFLKNIEAGTYIFLYWHTIDTRKDNHEVGEAADGAEMMNSLTVLPPSPLISFSRPVCPFLALSKEFSS